MAKFNRKVIPDDYEEVLRSKLKSNAAVAGSVPVETMQSIGILDLFRTYCIHHTFVISNFILFFNFYAACLCTPQL